MFSYTSLTLLLTALLAACGSDTAQVDAEGTRNPTVIELIQVLKDGNHFHIAKGSGAVTVYETSGYYPVGYLGYLPSGGESGTVRIYSCQAGGTDNFVSRRSDCEGRAKVKGDFSLYSSGGDNRAALYRCYDTAKSDHLMLRSQSCGGAKNEGLLGFVRTSPY